MTFTPPPGASVYAILCAGGGMQTAYRRTSAGISVGLTTRMYRRELKKQKEQSVPIL